MPEQSALAAAVLAGETPVFHPNTGEPFAEVTHLHPAAAAGLDVPRYCQLCGRRMVVQVRPDGWSARCSRHGELDSDWLYEEHLPA
ncbi:hypothetical protein HMPREF3227_02607 [Corynebacterium sp. CMW7794]|uniref:Biotin synthase auxiliary protein n=1 Tax=Corynebacterium phoceense TaxID=1686286 RepID=A0A540R492_9CORY|nr:MULTISPECIES: hypothetical protein [Corynebacterium]KXB56178.1 hypothetical protein HMPREF0307_00328 [Corynebacterium sp. DNF00584]KXI15312.1 hypothetical protein HMPREF3227_02607 [Corynebacterium sp. CMW7794]MBF9011532.1 hypothetical protein [Corynebacterium phoceense]MCQ9331991.1 hypothetical protein [Corynebacterium phoceense]MCQ9341074.1 hypothetical protein [Corynebacterium phoceense]